MKLSTEQIIQHSFGALEVQKTADGVFFHRLPRGLQEFYQKTEKFNIRMKCPCSVRMRFLSDTNFIKISMVYGERARELYQGSLFVDDAFYGVFGAIKRQKTWAGNAFQDSKKKERLFEVWLPHTCEITGFAIEIEDSCILKAAPEHKLKWLIYGDSLMQGMTASLPHMTNYAYCGQKLDADILNMSIGGAAMDAQLCESLPEYAWDIATIAYGANDYISKNKPKDVTVNAIKLLSALRKQRPEGVIILQTPICFLNVDEYRSKRKFEMNVYRRVLEAATHEVNNVHVIDGLQIMPNEKRYFDDDWHPNDKGMEIYGESLFGFISKILEDQGKEN